MTNKQRLELICWILLGAFIILGIPFIQWEQRKTHQGEFEKQRATPYYARSMKYCIYECMAARNTELNCNNWCRRD